MTNSRRNFFREIELWFFHHVCNWLVVWKHEFYFPFNIWDVILPIDFHIFQDGYCTTNQLSIIIIHHNYGKSPFSMGLYYQLYGVIRPNQVLIRFFDHVSLPGIFQGNPWWVHRELQPWWFKPGWTRWFPPFGIDGSTLRSRGNWTSTIYPLVNIQKTMENHHV